MPEPIPQNQEPPGTSHPVPGTLSPVPRSIHHAQLLIDLHKNPNISQREIASKNRVSLGKVNYAIKSLLDKGYIKIQNFKNAKNKRQYAYLLTPAGVYEKARRTADFLKWKMDEYERLRREIAELEADLRAHAEDSGV
jgi:EPS-associated MarR family transcriptional regulator